MKNTSTDLLNNRFSNLYIYLKYNYTKMQLIWHNVAYLILDFQKNFFSYYLQVCDGDSSVSSPNAVWAEFPSFRHYML